MGRKRSCTEKTTGTGSELLHRNEGVGEHVRTRFHQGEKDRLVKLRTSNDRSAPNEESLFLLRDRLRRRERHKSSIQPFDLMSRRHPLSSVGAFMRIGICSFRGEPTRKGSNDVPASSSRRCSQARLTSSSWRPCGSSSQSSSLRSSPSSSLS